MSEGQDGEEGEGQEQGEEREREGEREGGKVRCYEGQRSRRLRARERGRATLREQDRALLLAQPPVPPFPRTSCFGFNMPTFGTLVSNLHSLPPKKACGEATRGIFHGHNIATSSPLPHYHRLLLPSITFSSSSA